MKGGELRALTGARGIAAWLVVLYHIRLSLPPIPPIVGTVIDRGYLAVDFFFLLSGFVMALSWGERMRAGGLREVPGFLRRRFARVWPLHAVVLTGGVMLATLLWATGRHVDTDFPFRELPLHYLLIQNWGFTSALTWNDPAWSISAEFAAYLLFPLMALGLGRGSGAASLFGIALSIALLGLLFEANGAASLNHDVPRLGVFRCLIEFACGMMIQALWRRRASVLLGVGGTALLGAAWIGGYLPQPIGAPATFAALLLTLALTSGSALNPLEWRPVHLLGEWSYATYLAHFLMWKAFKLAFVATPGPVGWPWVALYLALVLGTSALLYTRVELPSQRWINGKRRTARSPATALR